MMVIMMMRNIPTVPWSLISLCSLSFADNYDDDAGDVYDNSDNDYKTPNPSDEKEGEYQMYQMSRRVSDDAAGNLWTSAQGCERLLTTDCNYEDDDSDSSHYHHQVMTINWQWSS